MRLEERKPYRMGWFEEMNKSDLERTPSSHFAHTFPVKCNYSLACWEVT